MWTKRLVAYFLVVVLWAVISVSPHVATSVAAVAPSALHRVAAPSVADFLQPDGTLDLPTGFAGGLDPTGYQLISAPSGTLRFAPSDPGDEYWADGFGYPGVSSYVNALTVDGQGNLYAGGRFTTAGGVSTNYIARWDGSAWHTLGSGMDSWVSALAVDGQGNLYAGGYFTTAGGESANRIARWDGSAWHALGSGMDSLVRALAVDGQGNLYAGGYFTTAGGESANRIARWDGSAWHALGSGMNDGVAALAVDGQGNLYAGGLFTTAGGVSANYIARWDGSAWHPLGSGMGSYVFALAVDGQGNLYAGSNYIARWDGSAWHAFGSGMDSWVYALAVDGQGNLYAGGYFTTAGGVNANYIARWDGSAWYPLGSGMGGYYPFILALAVDRQGNLYAGGDFTTAGGVSADRIARWDGSVWHTLGSGMNDGVYALAVDGQGNLDAGGAFTTAGGVSANRVARWDGSAWHAFGSGMGGYVNYPYVYALAVDGQGNLYAGGAFTTAGGVSANYIARWDGSAWHTLGSGMNDGVRALAVDGQGNLYAGGYFTTAGGVSANGIARWDGSAWHALGSGMNHYVEALAVDGQGNLYAGGSFTTAGGVSANYIARWDGSAWHALGSGMNHYVEALAVDGQGNLYAGGYFSTAGGVNANYIARWDGSAWHALGSGMNHYVEALAVDGQGNLYAGGSFTTAGGVSANYIARWDGSAWHALGSGMDSPVSALAVDGQANLYAGGSFTTAGGKPSSRIALWTGVAGQPGPTPPPPAPTPTAYPTPTPQPTPNPAVHYPVLLVHGWLGAYPEDQGRDCTLTAAPFDSSNPAHSSWADVAGRLNNDHYPVYVASLQTHRSYTPPLEVNAACLKRQVASVISQSQQDKVILIGHSMGGLVSRIYLEDSNLYQGDVERLITLGSPHGGVNYPAALIYPIPVGATIVCGFQPALCQFTNMVALNWIYHTRASNVPYTLIGGTWSDASSLRWLLSEGLNDSWVGLASATGRYWPVGTAVSGSQVQRLQTSSDHGGYFTGATRYDCIRRGLGLSGNCADADVLSQGFGPANDPILSGHTQDRVGSVQQGQVVCYTVAVDTSEHSVFMLSWLDGALAYTLTNPSGVLITPAYAAANPGIVSFTTAAASGEQPAWAAYAFTQTVPGPWTLWMGGATTPTTGSGYHTSVWMETARTLAAGANQELYQVGNTATLTATLTNGASGLAGATVQAILPRTDGITDTITLTDLGGGSYQASYLIPIAPGYVLGRVVATGSDGGTPYNREAALVFAISSQAAHLNGHYAVRTPDLNTDGRYDALLVDMGVVAAAPVTMSFTADLVPTGVAETLRVMTTTVLATGTQTVTLAFPGRDIHRARSSGPYTITNVLLYDLGLGGVLAQTANNVHVTGLYDYRQFGLRGDVDNSCAVDLFDLMAVTMEWGVTTFNPDVDLNRDDLVSVADIILVTSRWNETCWD